MNTQKYSQDSQDFALNKAKEYRYVNDEEYCENFIEQHNFIISYFH